MVFVYSIAWNMVSKGIVEIKHIVPDVLELNKIKFENLKYDLFFITCKITLSRRI